MLTTCESNMSKYMSWYGCERLHLASVNFFEDSFNAFAHFMMGDLCAHLPTPAECSVVFDKNGVSPMPHPPYTPDLTPKRLFFVFPDEKRPQHFASVE